MSGSRAQLARAAGTAIGLAAVLAALSVSAAARKGPARFSLRPELERRVQEHERIAKEAKSSPQTACALVESSFALLAPLSKALNEGRRASGPGADWSDAYADLGARLVGLYFVATTDYTATGIDYDELVEATPADAAPLLAAMNRLEGFGGLPAWIDQRTDWGGCHAPGNATRALAAVADAWGPAPACLKQVLRSRLERLLKSMAGEKCFCGSDESIVVPHLQRNAEILERLPDVGGPTLARALLGGARRYGCSGR